MSDYDFREMGEAMREITAIEKAPLAERKEAAHEYYEAMRDRPEVVAERVGWLLNGSYGYGHMLRAKRVLGSPRMNRVAALSGMVASVEWRCPGKGAVDAWKRLTPSEKHKVDSAIKAEITAAEKGD